MPERTLIQPVIERAYQDPDHTTLIMIDQDGGERLVTAGQFHQQASNYAQTLQQAGVGPEDLVVLVLKHSQVLLSAFWGALYLGAIPSIFPFLTEKLDPDLYMERVRTLVASEGAKAVITFPAFKQALCD
ncbi:MAG: AMP-binding protein [Anaerolineales bacterium]